MDPLLELAEQQHGLITLGQARSLGIGQQTVHRWASGPSWERLSDEVLRRRGSAPNRAQHVLAAVLDAGPGAFLSFASGAAWWRVPGPPLDPLGIVRVSRTSRPSGTGAEIHTVRSLPERWTTTLDAVPIVRPELLALWDRERAKWRGRSADSAFEHFQEHVKDLDDEDGRGEVVAALVTLETVGAVVSASAAAVLTTAFNTGSGTVKSSGNDG